MPVAFHYDSLVPASPNKRMKIMLNPDEHLRCGLSVIGRVSSMSLERIEK
jgi:hypothetical protein